MTRKKILLLKIYIYFEAYNVRHSIGKSHSRLGINYKTILNLIIYITFVKDFPGRLKETIP